MTRPRGRCTPRRSLLFHLAFGDLRAGELEDFLGALLGVALFDEGVDPLIALLVVHLRAGDQRGEVDVVFLVFPELAFEGAAQAVVVLWVERITLAGTPGHPVGHFLPEVVLAVLGEVELLLDGAQELFVRLLLAAGEFVFDGRVVDVSHDVVHVLLALALDLVHVVGQRVAHVLDGPLLVLLADEFEEAVVLAERLLVDRAVVLEVALEVVERRQRREEVPAAVHRIHDGLGDLVADEPRRDAVHPLADVGHFLGLLAELLHVDVVGLVDFAVVGFRLLDEVYRFVVRLLDAGEDAEQARHLQRVGLDLNIR